MIVVMNATSAFYSADEAARHTATIGELMEMLVEMQDAYGEDAPIIVSTDSRYTYGVVEWGTVEALE